MWCICCLLPPFCRMPEHVPYQELACAIACCSHHEGHDTVGNILRWILSAAFRAQSLPAFFASTRSSLCHPDIFPSLARPSSDWSIGLLVTIQQIFSEVQLLRQMHTSDAIAGRVQKLTKPLLL